MDELKDGIEELHIKLQDVPTYLKQIQAAIILLNDKVDRLLVQQPQPQTQLRSRTPGPTPTQRIMSRSPVNPQRITPTNPIREPKSPINPIREPKSPINPIREPKSPINPIREPKSPINPIREPKSPIKPSRPTFGTLPKSPSAALRGRGRDRSFDFDVSKR
jgi:hypothetical protein